MSQLSSGSIESRGAASVESSPLPVSTAWFVAIAATLTMSVSYVDRQALAALAPSVTEQLRISDAAYGWLQSAFSIAYLVGTPLAGMWIDRAGARRGLIVSMLVWTAVASLHSAVPGFASLFALRIALGFAESPGFPGAAQSVQRILPPAHRSAGFGVLFTGSSIGAAIAPPLAVALQNQFHSWRIAFMLTAIVGLAWVPLWFAATRDRRVQIALDRIEEPREANRRVPILPLLRDRAVLRAVVLVFCSAPLIGFILLWSAKYLRAVFHVPQSQVGRYLWLPPLCFDIGSILFGAFATHRDREDRAAGKGRRQHTALVVFATAIFTVGVAIPWAPTVWSMVLIAGVALIGGGALYALLTADMLARVPAHVVSTAGGLTAASQSLSYIAANIAIGAFVQRTHSYAEVAIALSLLALPGTLFWLARRVEPMKQET